jgi:hypothetical protein
MTDELKSTDQYDLYEKLVSVEDKDSPLGRDAVLATVDPMYKEYIIETVDNASRIYNEIMAIQTRWNKRCQIFKDNELKKGNGVEITAERIKSVFMRRVKSILILSRNKENYLIERIVGRAREDGEKTENVIEEGISAKIKKGINRLIGKKENV